MFQPAKVAFGELMARFYERVMPTTTALGEYAQRGFPYSVAWAPSRMVDQAEAMLDAWQRNDSKQATTTPPDLPVVLVAMAKDWTPVSPAFGKQIPDSIPLIFPDDPKERLFRARIVSGEVRVQMAVFASDEPSAKSLAAQLLLFFDSPEQRRFWATYSFAGFSHDYPVQVEQPDPPAQRVETNSRIVTALSVDLTLIATAPIFIAPKEGEPNDGKGVPGTDDPAGFPLVEEVTHVDRGLSEFLL